MPTSLSAKGQKQYYIRRGSNSVIANHSEIKQLMELAATVPYDDRVNHNAYLSDLDFGLIREFLQDIKSELFEQSASMSFDDLCRQMRIVSGPDEYIRPINAGLLFFNRHPENFFQGAITEIIQFKDDAGTQFSEKKFTGPIHHQIRAALDYVRNNIIVEKVVKVDGKAEANRFYNFPFGDYRNRRIGDFLKELDLTEGRGTGLPKIDREMEKNGSPEPIFETDENRTSFLAILPVNKSFNIDTSRETQFSIEGIDVEIVLKTLLFCYTPQSRKDILKKIGISNHYSNYKNYVLPLVEKEYLSMTNPENPKPNSRNTLLHLKVKTCLDSIY